VGETTTERGSRYRLRFTVRVIDMGQLMRVAERRCQAHWGQSLADRVGEVSGERLLEAATYEAMVGSAEGAPPAGVELTGLVEASQHADRYHPLVTVVTLTVQVTVTDPEALIAQARKRTWAACSAELEDLLGEMFTEHETLLERAIWETLVASNENPAPVDDGVEFPVEEELDVEEVDDDEPLTASAGGEEVGEHSVTREADDYWVSIRFGEGDVVDGEGNEIPPCEFHFATEAELHAFLDGVDAMDGWLAYKVVDERWQGRPAGDWG
jgi:hypothetical protein